MPFTYHTKTILKQLFKKIFIFLSVAFCLLTFAATAQSTQTITYTVKDGLPSNALYRTIIDKKGFLWVATEIGLSRFDGKKFRNYTTSDGLSDNEITDLFADSSGTVWVIPFRRTPCYYNPVTDRFENEETNKELSKIIVGTPNWPHILKYGGVAFSNNNREIFIYRNNTTSVLSNIYNKKFPPVISMAEYEPGNFLFFAQDSIRHFANGKLTAVMPVKRSIRMSEAFANSVYMATSNSILIYSFNAAGKVAFIKEKIYPFEIRIFCKTGKRFAITSVNGTTYTLDKNTLELSGIISAIEGVPVRNVLEDKDDNTWLATLDRGLVKVQQKRISSLANAGLTQSFNAIIKTKNIFAGNNNGEIYKYDGLYVKKLLLNNDKNIDTWVRKIINTSYGIYIASQSGAFLINEKTMAVEKVFRGAQNRSNKAACLLNDSIMLMGSHAFAFAYNLKNNTVIDSIGKRVVSLGSDLQNNIYIGSNEGLFIWKKNELQSMAEKRKSLSYKINTITSSSDSLMWIGLGSDSLVVLKNNTWVASIALGDIIPGNICKALCSNKAGEIWLGTNKGLNRINYAYNSKGFSYNNTYFGTADGLIGEQVNDITIQDSMVYAATNEGISYLPLNIQLPVSDINTFISSVSVNSVPGDLKDLYSLKYDENDISINFSGVDLTGFIPLFEYSVNGGKWQRTEKIELKKLASGNYKIKIRAIRRDGKPSNSEALVRFEISTPFWRSGFFWVLVVAVLVAALLYLQQRRDKRKQKTVVEKVLTEKRITELEMQALKAQINPHFVFNCLNSIKSFIYDKDYRQADKYLDRFSELMRSTIDHSDAAIILVRDEMNYLDNYLQLEKLRFEDKFDYKIAVDISVDTNRIFIPAMLLQPYVENAIRHGIRFLENRKGLIKITATTEDNFLICQIDDDGIGREKATQLKSKMHIEYQSKGMSISKRRAELYNIEQEITDKKDTAGNAAGTTIIVKIPLELKG
jgi:ligand-binding sensor domain-containing protein